MELDCFDVVKHTQQMGLYSVCVWCLPQNLQKSGVWDEEEARKAKPFFLQVPKWGGKDKPHKHTKQVFLGLN